MAPSSDDDEYSSLAEEEAALGLDPATAGDEEEDEEDGLGEDPAAVRARRAAEASARPPIYNAEALHEKLEDISWPSEAGWDESLVITGTDSAQVGDVDDDLARELAFYNQALAAAREAIGKLEAGGQKWHRPLDYYAEMVKSDEHMARVKQQLMHEQAEIAGAEERRKARESKRFSKQVAAEARATKAQAKKAAIGSISKLRRQRQRDGFAGELDMDAQLAAMEGGGAGAKSGARQARPPPQPLGQRIRPGEHKVGKKREAKNERYGFGGRKRLGKQNDASSAADMDSYRQGGFDDGLGRRAEPDAPAAKDRKEDVGPAGRGRGGRGGSRGGGRGGSRGGGRSPGSQGRGGGRSPGGVRRGGVAKKGGPNRPGKARRQAARQGS